MRAWRQLIVFALTGLVALGLGAQPAAREQGLPYTRSYSLKEYRALPQNWAVARDRRGLIYVGNSAGVLEFDGVSWRLIPTATLSAARSLAVSAEGQVYVGSVGDFGVLRPDSLGRLRYHSLLERVPEDAREFADVWRCFATPEGVFFQTRQQLFRYVPESGAIYVWRAETYFDIAFAVGSRVFVRQDGKGLHEVKGDELTLSAAGATFAYRRVFGVLPYPDDAVSPTKSTLLVVTREGGLYRWRGPTSVEPLPSAVAPLLDRYRVYTAEVLPGWRYCFGTLRGGLIVTDVNGSVVQTLDKRADGLQDQTIHHAMADGRGGLWLAMNNGVARVELPSPLSIYDERNGLRGVVESLLRHQGRLLAATNQGLFVLQGDGFVPYAGSTGQGRTLVSTPGGLLYATQDTVYRVEGGRLTAVALYRARHLTRSTSDSLRVWVGRTDGLASLRWQARPGRWIDEGPLPGLDVEISSVVESEEGLWLGTPSQGVWRVTFAGPAPSGPRVERFGPESGLPHGEVIVYQALGQARFQTVDGSYRFDVAQGSFAPDRALARQFTFEGDSVEGKLDYVTPLAGGKLWVALDGQRYVGKPLANGRYQLTPATALRRVTETIGSVEYFEREGTVWLGGYDGVVRYDPNTFKNYSAPFRTVIRRVRLGADSVVYDGGLDTLSERPVEFDYGFELLRVEYAALSFDNTAANQYQVRLEGIDRDWSPPSPDVRKDYTYLPEGSYTFRVRARNVYGTRSSEASFRFVVHPPWYRSWWGLSLWTVGGLGLLFGFVRWRVGRLRAEKEILETRVNERTAELSLQKEALQKAYHEIEEKNQDITDSIQYASRIQQALLPHSAELSFIFPEHFIYYQPRDIVSGDFYWFAQREGSVILAVCDCTGHGVPGALMSMMGNTLLNQIVIERGVTDPPSILEELDQRIRTLLRQGQQGSAYDGMEVTMVLWLPATRELVYSGAMLPLFVSRNGEIEELAPSKRGIGGRLDPIGPFESHRLRVDPGAIAYFATDGIGDQFGGPHKRKFMSKQLKEVLSGAHRLPLPEQGRRVAQAHRDWQGELDQVDDILVVGIRLP